MPRPIYEADANRITQQEIADHVTASWKLDGCAKMPDFHCVDFMILRGFRLAFAEMKGRTWEFGKHDGLYISLDKINRIRAFGAKKHAPCFLIFSFSDRRIRWTRAETYDRVVKNWGRRDRGDPRDIEPAAVFFWNRWREIKTPAKSAGVGSLMPSGSLPSRSSLGR